MRRHATLLFIITLLAGVVMARAVADDGVSAYTIANLAFRDGYWQVDVMTADGKSRRPLTRSAYDKAHLSAYPDGRRVLVNGLQGELAAVDVATGEELPIHYNNGPPVADATVSPDGKTIAFTTTSTGETDNNDIWIMRADGTQPRRLTTLPHMQHEPAWSADGQWIYFSSGTGGVNHDIWRVRVDGSQSEAITSGGLYHFDPAVAADGRVAFSNNRSGDYDIYIRAVDGRTDVVAPHPGLDAHPSWSPDGSQLLFDSMRGGAVNIWKYDLATKRLTQLTNAPVGARYPVCLHRTGTTP